ncbi:flagellar basal-body MS-ring/collar protein FliF [Alloalcanivorax gelatiniphagus]|uniref:Flagellar M-ring protein n=2 Tax=Alloalcanivorax gelatiniphagus TaxID=1194167 RepID=A0ABY2XFR6_9GAMM|nr:flagellar basal-body MS-ring/collar protein FliF [Alloalcanivorax gelatiniphagus]TMW10442.1 flagellar basal body M-ring protein FliF [Alloalcanivorax gelatiniphagus]|tara:strand:+ start:24506 stop:26218 length:1713 start_codon:yes stop_codon:yes gene_type:complete
MSNGTPNRPSGNPSGAEALLARLRANPLVPLLVGGAAVIAVVAALLMWASTPEYRVLFSNLSEADGGRIISELESRAVPYRFAEGGQALMVPGDQVHRLRLQLAEQGLPEGGNVGFEIMDRQAFGISQFAERVNFQRGLQGELASSIEALGPVARARVHLSMAKPSVFIRDREPAKASVILTLAPGRVLGEGQVNAIVHLVSGSVPELAMEDVTVVDQAGRLLSRPEGGTGGLDGSQLEYVRDLERGYRQRIESILAPILGRDRVRAQVVADVDFSRREQTSERYGPNQDGNPAAVRSRQLNEQYRGGEDLAAGVPGALSNTPPGAAPSPIQNDPANADGNGNGANTNDQPVRRLNQDSVVNYEVDRDVTHVQHQRARLERLSVAVVVDYHDVVNDQGETVSEPLDPERLERIRQLVRQAMGYSEARGDGLEVLNSPFTEDTEVLEPRDWWRDPFWQTLLLSLGRWLLVGLAALLLFLYVIRPLLRRFLEQRPALAPQAAVAPAPVAAAPYAARPNGDAQEPRAQEPAQPRRRRQKNGAHEQNLKDLQEMAQEDPAMVAMIVRSWMNRND